MGANIPVGTTVTITGTASDTGGGSVQSVQVSVDGGVTYNTAMGTTMWSYNWTPASAGPALIRSRAVDNRGNQQTTPARIIVTVVDPGSPLKVVSTTPAPWAADVPIGVTPTAVFSKALSLGSLSAGNPDMATILMRDASNNPVPFNVYVHVPTLRVILLPEQELQPDQTYTVTFKGGPNAPHITDEAGMPLASDYILSFTTTGPRITTSTIFAGMPRNPIVNDPSPAELGLKFSSDITGLIGGVRFYKGGAANGGQHVGRLWTIDGTLLGSVTFANETDSGWQQALFQNPIPITAFTHYVVSYFAPQGHYAADDGYFSFSGVDHAPLHALSDLAAGGNGVFLQSPAGGFPTGSSQATNYWVEVVFIDLGNFNPKIVSATPAPGSLQVPITATPTAAFSQSLDPDSVNESTVLMSDVWNDPVPATISYDTFAFKVTITPARPLQPGGLYTVTFKGGAFEPHITDFVGTPLASDYTWSFAAAISPSALPLLVITTAGNDFAQYYQEILRAEGFNNLNAVDITQITSSTLAQYDMAILGETRLTSEQVTMLSDWVAGGGNLIAMRPDKQLASLLGINDASSVQTDAYLLVNTAQAPGAGIVDQTIQYHGPADLYTLNGASAIASIYSNPTQVTSNPAVTLHSVGTNGGQAAAFTFDLAQSIYDYVNLDEAAIPQSRELRRLLGNMILSMVADRGQPTRFWYFPKR
jgi:hypothetical protein